MRMKDTLKYRNIWLGCAMLWIVLYHANFSLPISLFGYFKGMGYGGVDICLFASGIGCYYSLENNSDILEFVKRRLKRLVPTYWCFLVLWFICKAFMGKFEVSAILGNILGVQSFTGQGNEFNWYISALILLYLLAPFLKNLVDRITKKYQFVLIMMVLLAISVAYWDADKFIIIMIRLPVFCLGMIYARFCRDGKELEKKSMFMLILATIIGVGMYFFFRFSFEDYLWKFGLYWYPFILITPGMCVVISIVMYKYEKYQWCMWLQKKLNMIGSYSFEIYLVHLLVFEITTYLIEVMHIIPNTNVTWIVSVAVVAMGCIILKRIVKKTVSGMVMR